MLVVAGVGLLLAGAGVLVYAAWSGRGGHAPTDHPPSERAARRPLAGFGEIRVTVTDPAGTVRKWCLLSARNEGQHQRGLMEVRDPTLRGHDGMVFIFESDQHVGFWMRNTPMPLSVAYHDRRGRFVSKADMKPCVDAPTCHLYPPARSYRYAVEVVRGGLAHLGIEPGAVLQAGGRCAPPPR